MRETRPALRKPTIKRGPINIARQALLRLTNMGLTTAYKAYRVHPAIWRYTARNYQPGLERIARLNAWMICQQASLDVPAYQDYLVENDYEFTWWDLQNYPATNKQDYVTQYSEDDRCWNGTIETVGTVVDESSGSSGKPFNWMRSKKELDTVHRNVAGYVTFLFGSRDLFCINAFSMGAWATGTNTGLAMAKVAMVKNTGPDLEKIIDTLEHFGPGHTYLISAYPPFLKHLVDYMDNDTERGPEYWDQFTLNGFVGGEAMTEGLREHVEKRFNRVYSGYGASDLTIGMAGETDVAVEIRKELTRNNDFRTALLGDDESRVPMIFQYNPLETFLETTEDNELIVTINSSAVMSPRLRYNIGDEATLMSFDDMVNITRAFPHLAHRLSEAFKRQGMRLPFVLLFGRSDSTISYMGANIYPLDVENGLYRDERYAPLIDSFRIELRDTGALEMRPTLHIQLRGTSAAENLDADQREQMRTALTTGILEHLSAVSRDFKQSLEEDPSAADIRVELHDHGTGPFAEANKKIKNTYLMKS